MKSCLSCDRHVRPSESTCPFCRAPLREAAAPIAAVLGLAGLLIGCSDDGISNGDDAGSVPTTGATTMADGDDSGNDSATSTSNGATSLASDGSFDTSTTDGDSSVDDSDAGAGFIYGGGDAGPVRECDVLDNDCPEGEKCMPWANDGGDNWNATRCAPIAPEPAAVGEPCTVEGNAFSSIDDCGEGLMCFHVDAETNEGTCVSFCEAGDPPSCADEGLECAVLNEGIIAVCLLECDPTLRECADGLTCTDFDEAGAYCY